MNKLKGDGCKSATIRYPIIMTIGKKYHLSFEELTDIFYLKEIWTMNQFW